MVQHFVPDHSWSSDELSGGLDLGLTFPSVSFRSWMKQKTCLPQGLRRGLLGGGGSIVPGFSEAPGTGAHDSPCPEHISGKGSENGAPGSSRHCCNLGRSCSPPPWWVMRAGSHWEGSAHRRRAGEGGLGSRGWWKACGQGPARSTQKASVFFLSAALLGVFKSELAQCFCSCK